MRKLGLAALVSLLAVGLVPLEGAAQGYEPPTRANPKDVYCSGFMASTELPANLRIVMAEDAVGRIIYSQNDYVYLSQGSDGGVAVGQRYMVVRPVYDPNPVEAFKQQNEMHRWKWSKHWVGRVYQDIGWLEVKLVHPTTSTAVVTHTCDALQAGDVLIPFEERPAPEYKPSAAFDRFAPPTGKAAGTIVLGKDFGHLVAEGDTIYVNVGSSDGVRVGSYLRVFRRATGTRYEGYKRMGKGQVRTYAGVPGGYEIPKMRPDLPREVLGEALVVRVGPNTATAVITFSLREMHAGDFVELE